MLEYRTLDNEENIQWQIQCKTLLSNSMQCTRRVTRFVICPSITGYLCEGHFQVLKQTAIANGEEIIDTNELKTKSSKEETKTEP